MAVHWVEIGGVTLASDGEGGIGFTKITGWYDLPSDRGGGDARPGFHGAYGRTHLLREQAAISVEGAIWAHDRAELERLRHMLLQAWAGLVLMRVADETGVWERAIEIDTVAFSDPKAAALGMVFTVDAVAPDPVRYRDALVAGPLGLQKSVGGLSFPARFPWSFGQLVGDTELEVLNPGAVPMFPVLRLSGGFSRATVTDQVSGRVLSFGAVPRGSEVVIDTRSRRASVGGLDQSRRIERRGWPVIAPRSVGVFRVAYESPVGDPMLNIEYREGAW